MPETRSSIDRIAQTIGLSGLFLFALCLWLSSAGAYIALGIMFCSFCLETPAHCDRLKKDPLVVLFCLFLIFLFLQSIHLQSANISGFRLKPAWDWISLWLFILVAWQFKGKQQPINKCLVLAVIGLILRLPYEIVFEIGLGPFIEQIQQNRYSLMFSLNEAGHYGAVMLFGFLLFGPRLLKRKDLSITTWLSILFWTTGFGLSLEILLLSGSRSSWLAFALIAIILLPWFYYTRQEKQTKERSQRFTFYLPAVVCLILLVLLFVNLGNITHRISFTIRTNAHALHELLNFDMHEVPFQDWDNTKVESPLIRRLIQAYYGMELFKERPWFGWGTTLNLNQLLAKKTGIQKIGQRKHLHNGLVILLARFGLIGSMLFGLGATYVVYSLVFFRNRKTLSRDVFAFLLGSLLITGLVGMVNFRWTQMGFRFFWLLLAGMAATGRIWRTR